MINNRLSTGSAIVFLLAAFVASCAPPDHAERPAVSPGTGQANAGTEGAPLPWQHYVDQGIERGIPEPLAGNPGNIFLEGQQVMVDVPVAANVPAGGDGQQWALLDYDNNVLREGRADDNGRADLGVLPVGFYELRSKSDPNRKTTIGVLARLRVPTPLTSPICLDVAMSWEFKPEKFEGRGMFDQASNFAALAGINRIRDRYSWGQSQQSGDEPMEIPERYMRAAVAQRAAGLQVLTVWHDAPPWAAPHKLRFPTDLRDAYTFSRQFAAGFRGLLTSVEPWNEPDIDIFGGHTGAEIAAYQKACYLGLKATSPELIVCMAVPSRHRETTLQDFAANNPWAYMETANLHHYREASRLPAIYEPHRAASGGRPLWVTEASIGVPADKETGEPSPADMRTQAERIPRVYAWSIYEGCQSVFYFILGDFHHGDQKGVLRADMTPRPAYLALAASGRLLADARPLGRLKAGAPGINGVVLAARPDGHDREVLVIWGSAHNDFVLPVEPEAVYDHIGRLVPVSGRTVAVRGETVMAILPVGTHEAMELVPPPPMPEWIAGKASPIILQPTWNPELIDIDQSAFRIRDDAAEEITVFVYNLSEQLRQGRLKIETTSGIRARLSPQRVVLDAWDRQPLTVTVERVPGATSTVETISIEGDFGEGERPVASFRVMPWTAGAERVKDMQFPE